MRLILIFSFPAGSPAALHGMHLHGTGASDLAQIESLVKVGISVLFPSCETQVTPPPQEGETYALGIYTALNAKLKDEERRRTEKARLKFSAIR